MARRKGSTTLRESDYYKAYRIAKGFDIINVDFEDDQQVKLYKLPIIDNNDPETIFLRKEALSSLSEEAKEVVDMLLKAPQETIKALSTPKGLITKRSIRLGLQKLWNSKFIAKLVVEELTRWANRF